MARFVWLHLSHTVRPIFVYLVALDCLGLQDVLYEQFSSWAATGYAEACRLWTLLHGTAVARWYLAEDVFFM